MIKTILALSIIALGAIPARAITPRMGLAQPAHSSLNWDIPLNANAGIIDSSAAIQGSTNTFTSSNTFVTGLKISSATIYGSIGTPVVPGAGLGGIYYDTAIQDFKMSRNGGAWAAFPGAAASSSTVIPNSSTAQTTFIVAVATVSITTSGGPVRIAFAGTTANNTNNSSCFLSFIEDGVFVSPFTSVLAITSMKANGAGSVSNTSFSYIVRAPSSGLHSYALVIRSDANTCTITNGSPYAGPQWSAVEIR